MLFRSGLTCKLFIMNELYRIFTVKSTGCRAKVFGGIWSVLHGYDLLATLVQLKTMFYNYLTINFPAFAAKFITFGFAVNTVNPGTLAKSPSSVIICLVLD